MIKLEPFQIALLKRDIRVKMKNYNESARRYKQYKDILEILEHESKMELR